MSKNVTDCTSVGLGLYRFTINYKEAVKKIPDCTRKMLNKFAIKRRFFVTNCLSDD